MIECTFDYLPGHVGALRPFSERRDFQSPKDALSFMLGLLVFDERSLVNVRRNSITVEEVTCATSRWTFTSTFENELGVLLEAAYYLLFCTRSDEDLLQKVRAILSDAGVEDFDAQGVAEGLSDVAGFTEGLSDVEQYCGGCALAYAITLGITDWQQLKTCAKVGWESWETFLVALDLHLELGEPLGVVMEALSARVAQA